MHYCYLAGTVIFGKLWQYFFSFCTSSYPEVLNHIIFNCECCTAQPVPYVQHSPPPCLPHLPLPEEPVKTQHCITGLFPLSLSYDSDVLALGQRQSYHLLLIIPHSACLHTQTCQIHSSMLSCMMVQHETHTNTAAFRIQALIGCLFLSLSFPTIGRTEENILHFQSLF